MGSKAVASPPTGPNWHSVSKPGRDKPADLWILDADGKRRKLVDNQYVLAWSPDGKRLATCRFTDREMENAIVDVATGRVQPLPIPRHDQVNDWSPDGQELAVMAGNPKAVFPAPEQGDLPAPSDRSHEAGWVKAAGS